MASYIRPWLLCWPGCCPCVANLTAVRLYYIISDFPICKWADLFLQAQGGLWNTHCICSLLEWSWILWQKASGNVKAGHLLHCRQWMLLGAFFLQVVVSESDTRSFPPALPASFSASSRKCLALCWMGWLCTSNLPIPSYVLSKRWMRRREGEKNYTYVIPTLL